MKDGDVLKVRGSARPLDDFRPREGMEPEQPASVPFEKGVI